MIYNTLFFLLVFKPILLILRFIQHWWNLPVDNIYILSLLTCLYELTACTYFNKQTGGLLRIFYKSKNNRLQGTQSLTCKGLVPLADTVGLSTEPLNVFQVGFRMEEPLCLWWGGDEHGCAGLLHDGLAGGALPGIRWRRLLARWAQDPDLQSEPGTGHTTGATQGGCRELPSLGAFSCNGGYMQKPEKISPETHALCRGCTEGGSANRPFILNRHCSYF